MFKLQNVRRATGDAGRLSGFTEIVNETETNVFIKPNGTTSPWPGSMYLVVSHFLKVRFYYFDCRVPVRPMILLAIVNSVALKALINQHFQSYVDSLSPLYIILNHDFYDLRYFHALYC